jgi:hypothetical protein
MKTEKIQIGDIIKVDKIYRQNKTCRWTPTMDKAIGHFAEVSYVWSNSVVNLMFSSPHLKNEFKNMSFPIESLVYSNNDSLFVPNTYSSMRTMYLDTAARGFNKSASNPFYLNTAMERPLTPSECFLNQEPIPLPPLSEEFLKKYTKSNTMDIKEGSEIKVTKKHSENMDACWVSKMDKTIGKTATVVNVFKNIAKLKFHNTILKNEFSSSNWVFPVESLELLEIQKGSEVIVDNIYRDNRNCVWISPMDMTLKRSAIVQSVNYRYKFAQLKFIDISLEKKISELGGGKGFPIQSLKLESNIGWVANRSPIQSLKLESNIKDSPEKIDINKFIEGSSVRVNKIYRENKGCSWEPEMTEAVGYKAIIAKINTINESAELKFLSSDYNFISPSFHVYSYPLQSLIPGNAALIKEEEHIDIFNAEKPSVNYDGFKKDDVVIVLKKYSDNKLCSWIQQMDSAISLKAIVRKTLESSNSVKLKFLNGRGEEINVAYERFTFPVESLILDPTTKLNTHGDIVVMNPYDEMLKNGEFFEDSLEIGPEMKFKKDDIVRIKRKNINSPPPFNWIDSMDDTIGKLGVITKYISKNHFRVNSIPAGHFSYTYVEDCLEFAENEVTNKKTVSTINEKRLNTPKIITRDEIIVIPLIEVIDY